MGKNYYLTNSYDLIRRDDRSGDGQYHLGKSSGGWQFTFDLAFLRIWEILDDPLWDIAKIYLNRTGQVYKYPYPAEPVIGITEQDIWNLIEKSDYLIDENESIISLNAFKHTVNIKKNGLTQYTAATYQEDEDVVKRFGYSKDFIIGGLRFSSNTDFC